MRVPLEQLTFYAFCDPAGGKKPQELKRVRANSAIVCVGADALTRCFVVEWWEKRASTEEMTNKIFEINQKWKPRIFGCEANAMQELYGDMVQLEAKHRNVRLPLSPVYQPKGIDKNYRIRTGLQPVIRAGRLFFPETMIGERSKLASFPMNIKQVDGIDALENAVRLVPRRAAPKQRTDEVEAVARYLRDTGAAPHVIEARVRELIEAGLRN